MLDRASNSGESLDPVQALFADYLARVDAGEQPDFEAFVASHPDDSERLREMHEELRRFAPILEVLAARDTLEARIERTLGDVDPRVRLQAEDSGVDDEALEELLGNLRGERGSARRYRVRRVVGRGGMGVVLKVWDDELKRHIAMKLVRAQHESDGEETPPLDPRTLRRFLTEAQVTAQLEHPGIVPVHEIGVDDRRRVYFTMSLVRGRDLDEVLGSLGEGGWTPERVTSALLKACEAVAYAHEHGVVHRDLKPANVRLGEFGEVYVMDWGVARVRRPDGDTSADGDTPESPASGASSALATRDGQVLGTPSYMSPEQARGELDAVGPRTDVYAFGAMLYRLLAGRAPYVEPDEKLTGKALAREVLARVRRGPPRPVHSLATDRPVELIAICERAMAYAAEERYPDVAELARDLQAFLDGRPVVAHATDRWTAMRKWMRRNRALAASLLVAQVSLLVGLALSGWFLREARASERSARSEGYVANVVAADASLNRFETAEALRRLEACPPPLRGWEWDHLRLAADTRLAHASIGATFTTRVAYRPDPTRFRLAWGRAGPELLDANDGGRVLLGPDLGRSGRLVALADDGSTLARAGWKKPIAIMSLEHRELLAELEVDGDVVALEFAPGSARLAARLRDGSIRIWNASSWADPPRQLMSKPDLLARGTFAFTPDGRHIVACSSSTAYKVDVQSSRVERLAEAPTTIGALAVSPDGRRAALAAGSGLSSDADYVVLVVDLGNVEPPRELRGHAAPVQALAFSPDGERLASGAQDSSVRTWVREDGVWRRDLVLRGHAAPIETLHFVGPRVLRAGTRDGEIGTWALDAAEPFDDLRTVQSVNALDVSSDGGRIAAGTDGECMVVWDATTLELEQRLRVGDWVWEAALLPPGNRAVTLGAEGGLVAWSLADGERLWERRLDGIFRAWLRVSRDGRLLTVHDGKELVVLAAETGAELARLPAPALGAANDFSPDGRLLAVAGDEGAVVLYDTERFERKVAGPPAGPEATALEFSPDGELLAAGLDDGRLCLLDPAGRPLVHLDGHAAEVTALAWLPGGRRLVSASEDGSARVWDPATGDCLLVLPHDAALTDVAVTPDGTRIVTSSGERVRIFETRPVRDRLAAR